MKRLTLFLVFLLLAGLLAPAHFAKAATTSYYGLSFDGSGYVEAPNNFNLENFTVILIGDIHWTGNWQCFFNKGTHGVWFGVAGVSTRNLYLLIGDGTAWKQAHTYYTSTVFDRVTMIGARWNGETSSIIVNGKVVSNKTYTGTSFTVGDDSVVRIGDQHYSNAYPSNGTIYEVLVYNRALSDSEIQAIYADPLNPPTSGLVLFYAPDSVDPAANVWHDKSGNGNDGSIVGATYVPLRPLSESEPSKDSPVALYFENNAYVQLPVDDSLKPPVTVALIFKPTSDPYNVQILRTGSAHWNGLYALRTANYRLRIDVNTEDGNRTILYDGTISANNTYFVAFSWDYSTARLYLDREKSAEASAGTVTGGSGFNPVLGAVGSDINDFIGEIYAVLIYHRVLSDAEIQAIYNDPLHPPTDGLVLWYSPYTYDPSSGKWLNRAPIFPTINLTEELDGTNYGATPERILISKIYAKDAKRGFLLPFENYTITDENGTSYIPSFVTFPYSYLDKYITINVSAPNYYPTITQVQPPFQDVTIDIYPIPTYTVLMKASAVVHAKPSNEGGIMDFFDLFKYWPGGNLGVDAMRFNIKALLTDFFSDSTIPYLGQIVAIIIWATGVILAWSYSKEPEFTAVWGYVLYLGFSDFIAAGKYINLLNAVMVPFAFIISMMYLKKILDVFGGE